jgi:hypothetical protein
MGELLDMIPIIPAIDNFHKQPSPYSAKDQQPPQKSRPPDGLCLWPQQEFNILDFRLSWKRQITSIQLHNQSLKPPFIFREMNPGSSPTPQTDDNQSSS